MPECTNVQMELQFYIVDDAVCSCECVQPFTVALQLYGVKEAVLKCASVQPFTMEPEYIYPN